MTHAARPLQLRRDRGVPIRPRRVLARAARAHNPPRFAGATASASLTLPHSRERCPPRRPTTPPRSRARATWPRPGPFAEPRFAPPRASPGARHAAPPCASTPRVRPPPYSAPPRPAPATSGASPPRLPASPRANARPAACVTETARVTWQTRRHVATGRIPTPLAADAARPRAIERRRGPRAGTRARSPTRRLASARDHRGGPSRASAPRDDDVVAPYPQLDREPGGFVTCRVSDALSRFRRRRKRREDLDETVGVESSSNALAPTGRRVRRGRAIIRAPIILTDPPPSSPRGGFVVSPLFLFFSARSLREEPRGDA